ncbi:hypothetical protein T484DRAFT_1937532, partial [Baffinella frigidus]
MAAHGASAQPRTFMWRRALTAGLLAAAAVPSSGFAPGMAGFARGSGVESATPAGARRACSSGALGLRAALKIPSFPGGDELAEEVKGSLGRFMRSAGAGLPRAYDTASVEVFPIARAVILKTPLKQAREEAEAALREREERKGKVSPVEEDAGPKLDAGQVAALKQAAVESASVEV